MEMKRYCEYCGTLMNPGEEVCPNCKQVPVAKAYFVTPVKRHSFLSKMALICLAGGLGTTGATAVLGLILAIIDLVRNDPDEKHTISKIVLGIGVVTTLILVSITLSRR